MRSCVLLLNWNRWEDTIECLESLFRSEKNPGPIVVCDNDSTDGSIEYLRAWAEGRINHWLPPHHPLRDLSSPPVDKPIEYVEYDRPAAEAGGRIDAAGARLVLIQTGANLGFAGGNNVGLRYFLARPELDCVWILNNDTVVKGDALLRLVTEAERDPRLGMCGSTLLYYDDPESVQALGGARFNSWLALPTHIGAFSQPAEQPSVAAVEERLDYVIGASMLVTRSFLEDVGLLSEDYFLYFEELDWAMRAKNRFRLGFVPESVVYHKEGRSAGTNGANDKSLTADYYFLRNRLLVTRRYFPSRLPTVRIALLVALARRIRRRQWDRVRLILDLWREG